MPRAEEGEQWSGSWQLLGKTESHRNERDPKVVQVWDCMVEGRLIRIVWSLKKKKICLILPISTRCIFFSVARTIITPQFSVFDLEQFWDG
jgi:hypothetical protein